MAKFKRGISKHEQEKLFIEFAEGLSSLQSPIEIAKFIKDLLSEPETIMLARRLRIAKLLHDGWTYDQINETMGAGFGTIAKVQTWMQIYGEGYRAVITRSKKTKEPSEKSSWRMIQRKYPAYFWPQLLLEEIVNTANAKQKNRIKKVLTQLKEKSALSKQLDQILKTAHL